MRGALGDGGLISTKAHGGICLAQKPEESYMLSMPQNTIPYDDLDQILSAFEMIPALRSLANEKAVEPAAQIHLLRCKLSDVALS